MQTNKDKKYIALFLDAQNIIKPKLRFNPEDFLNVLKPYGKVSIKRAYADYNPRDTNLVTDLLKQGFESIPVKPYSLLIQKLIVDAMELMFTAKPDIMAIASSQDFSYIPLFNKAKDHGIETIAIYHPTNRGCEHLKKTADYYINMENIRR